MLRAEGSGEVQVGQRSERVEGMRQIGGDRCRMGEQGDALAGERFAQIGFGQQAVESKTNRHDARVLISKAEEFTAKSLFVVCVACVI